MKRLLDLFMFAPGLDIAQPREHHYQKIESTPRPTDPGPSGADILFVMGGGGEFGCAELPQKRYSEVQKIDPRWSINVSRLQKSLFFSRI